MSEPEVAKLEPMQFVILRGDEKEWWYVLELECGDSDEPTYGYFATIRHYQAARAIVAAMMVTFETGAPR